MNVDLEDGEIESDIEDLKNSLNSHKTYENKDKRCENHKILDEILNESQMNSQLNRAYDNENFKLNSLKRKISHENESSPKPLQCNKADNDELNESDNEMVYVRGASPVDLKSNTNSFLINYENSDENHLYYQKYYRSDDENDSLDKYCKHKNRRRRHKRKQRKERKSKKEQPRNNRSASPKCNEEQSSAYENIKKNEIRKLEICKFYLMDRCVKPLNCDYMHSDFPCKYFYLGMECLNKPSCKFMHGKTLGKELKTALIRHIASAPRSILGDFKRLTYKEAESLIEIRNSDLLKLETQQNFKVEKMENKESNYLTSNLNIKHEKLASDKVNITNDENCQNHSIYNKNYKTDGSDKKNEKNKEKCENNFIFKYPKTSEFNNLLTNFKTKDGKIAFITKLVDERKDEDIDLKNSNLPSYLVEKLAKHNITNLRQYNQLSLHDLDNLLSDVVVNSTNKPLNISNISPIIKNYDGTHSVLNGFKNELWNEGRYEAGDMRIFKNDDLLSSLNCSY